ncbi:MAG: TrkA C-terminal domain-containing protein, partial [Methanothrix sp.]
YEMFRSISKEPYCTTDLSMIQNEFITIKVPADSPAAGKSLKDIGLREMGISLLAVNRESQVINHPDESFVLQPDDVAIILGSEAQLSSVGYLFGKDDGSQNVAS